MYLAILMVQYSPDRVHTLKAKSAGPLREAEWFLNDGGNLNSRT